MTYDDATESTITQARAKREIQGHSLSFYEFVEEYGLHDTYKGQDVLNWLGY